METERDVSFQSLNLKPVLVIVCVCVEIHKRKANPLIQSGNSPDLETSPFPDVFVGGETWFTEKDKSDPSTLPSARSALEPAAPDLTLERNDEFLAQLWNVGVDFF